VPPAGFEPAHPPPEAGQPSRLRCPRRAEPVPSRAPRAPVALTDPRSSHEPLHDRAASSNSDVDTRRPRVDAAASSRSTRDRCSADQARGRPAGRRKPGKGTFDRFDAALDTYGRELGIEMTVLGREAVNGMVDLAPDELKWAYADMFAGWDLLRYLIDAQGASQRDRGCGTSSARSPARNQTCTVRRRAPGDRRPTPLAPPHVRPGRCPRPRRRAMDRLHRRRLGSPPTPAHAAAGHDHERSRLR